MLISIVTPTARRPSLLPLLYACIAAQDWPDWEWLIHDGSAAPWSPPPDPRIRYTHAPSPVSLGEKRNRLAELAQGELIAHFDDDDYYAPGYLTAMAVRLGQAALVKLAGFFAYRVSDGQFAYWDLMQKTGRHYEWRGLQPARALMFDAANAEQLADNHLGYGFSYVYRREAWSPVRFPDVRFNEDGAFIKGLMRSAPIKAFKDTQGLVLHVHHRANTSRLYPQHLLGADELSRRFPQAEAHLRRLHEIFS